MKIKESRVSIKINLTRTFLLLVGIVAVATAYSGNPRFEEEMNRVYLKQDGKLHLLQNDNRKMLLSRSPFSIIFYNRAYDGKNRLRYSAQISAFTDDNLFKSISEGMSTHSVAPLRLGTGLAATREQGYKWLYLNAQGHHYLYYNDNDQSRLRLLGKESSGYLKLEFPVSHIYRENAIAIEEIPAMDIDLVIFIDRNLNGQIEKGELTKKVLSF